MAFIGDLVVKLGANVSPFQAALKKAQSMTKTFRDSLTDMRTVAGVFSKLAASIKAVNNQMNTLVHISKQAVAATRIQEQAEMRQFRARMKQYEAMIAMARKNNQESSRGPSMMTIAGGVAGGFGITAAVRGVKDLGVGIIKLASDAEQMQITFEVLTGSQKEGVKLFKDIEKFARRTSFNLESAGDAARQLMASGVDHHEVINTLELLGNLAMGDANKLGFLAKAYTDVHNKGRLQAQELRQFAENGVGLIGALSKQLGKSAGEILEMSEGGEISFKMMQDALLSLTAQGGRFHNMMERINKTTGGLWNSFIEGVQSIGRDLGAKLLPELNKMLVWANDILTKFSAMPNKFQFAADVLVAALDVGMIHIRQNWDKMLADMAEATAKFVKAPFVIDVLKPGQKRFQEGIFDANNKPVAAVAAEQEMQKAQNRLGQLLDRFNAGANGGVPEREGIARRGFNKQAIEKQPNWLMNLLAKGVAAGSFVTAVGKNMAKVVTGSLAGLGKGKLDLTKPESRFASVAQRKTQEANAIILANMSDRKSPEVATLEKLLKVAQENLKATKSNKPPAPQFAPEFA